MLEFNNIAVHIFTEESREEIDLEFKLRNKITEEAIKEFHKIALKKGRKAIFEPFVE